MNAILALLVAGFVPAASLMDTLLFLAADSPHLQYSGRVAKNGSQVLWDWSGVKTSVRLKCPANVAVDLQFHIDVPALKTINPFYKDQDVSKYSVLVNGASNIAFKTKAPLYVKATRIYNVTLPAISDEVRVIELVKNTEEFVIPIWASWSEGGKPTVFHGISIPRSCTPQEPPERPTRRLEFIGDSITCGFGNLAKNLNDYSKCVLPPVGAMHGWLNYEDFSLAFPSLISQSFHTEMHTQCISQIGITRNGLTLTKRTPYNMSHYVHRTVPTLPDFLWDYQSWTPDLAVVNLGTNDYDFSQMFHEQPSFADFEGNYTKFLADYVIRNGDRLANLLVLCGPMTKTQCPSVNKVATNLKALFPKLNVRYFEVTATLTGCALHPAVEGHRQMYEQIAPVISEMTHWKLEADSVIVV